METHLATLRANLINIDNHRFASFRNSDGDISDKKSVHLEDERLKDSLDLAVPRYWVSENEVLKKIGVKSISMNWFLAFRRSVRSTDARTALFSALPVVGVGDSIFLATANSPAEKLLANLNSTIFDYIARQCIGGENASFFIIKQLPAILPFTEKDNFHISSRTLELTYTARDLEAFAKDCGYDGPPSAG